MVFSARFQTPWNYVRWGPMPHGSKFPGVLLSSRTIETRDLLDKFRNKFRNAFWFLIIWHLVVLWKSVSEVVNIVLESLYADCCTKDDLWTGLQTGTAAGAAPEIPGIFQYPPPPPFTSPAIRRPSFLLWTMCIASTTCSVGVNS